MVAICIISIFKLLFTVTGESRFSFSWCRPWVDRQWNNVSSAQAWAAAVVLVSSPALTLRWTRLTTTWSRRGSRAERSCIYWVSYIYMVSLDKHC